MTWQKEKQPRVDAIRRIANRVREEVLCHTGKTDGLCYDASVFLCRSLRRYGYQSRIANGDFMVDDPLGRFHFWVVLVPSNIVVDITADQFQSDVRQRIPKVVINELCHRYRECGFRESIRNSWLTLDRDELKKKLREKKHEKVSS